MQNAFIIGITGGTGSGKTTIVNEILKDLSKENVGIISQDSYYKSTDDLTHEERCAINFDHPESIDFKLLENHVTLLKKGKTIKQPVYSFTKHNRTKETVITHPKKVLLIEGILIFNSKIIRNLCDVKIFIHADADNRLIRRMRRDILQRGRSTEEVLVRYETTLKNMHEKFIEPTKKFSDIIIPNNHYNKVGINTIKSIITHYL